LVISHMSLYTAHETYVEQLFQTDISII